VPGIGTIEVDARNGVVELRRLVAGHLMDRVVVTFRPGEEAPEIRRWHAGQTCDVCERPATLEQLPTVGRRYSCDGHRIGHESEWRKIPEIAT
jgi:hypothetical protein